MLQIHILATVKHLRVHSKDKRMLFARESTKRWITEMFQDIDFDLTQLADFLDIPVLR